MAATIARFYYNPPVRTEDLKILLALEAQWTVSLNGVEFVALPAGDIFIQDSTIRFGRHSRKILEVEWLRLNVVRLRGQSRFRSQTDTITFYPGAQLPSTMDLRRRRRVFQNEISRAICSYLSVRKMERQTLYSDKQHGIGGAYPRFVAGKRAVITVHPDESSAVINGLMRAALLWGPLVRRRVAAVVPYGRHHTLSSRLRVMPEVRQTIEWLQWNGTTIGPLEESAREPETHVHEFAIPDVGSEVSRICALAPDLLQAVPHIAGRAVSVRLRGLEVARVSADGTMYPLAEPLEDIIHELDMVRRQGSRHPLARAHEEQWLESNLVREIHQLLPFVNVAHIYPQVPSFVGEERSIIDLLTVTDDGRLVIIEVKASPDPDLPFQALDYWIAVERHRKARDFENKGYFTGCKLRDEPALLVLVAPLLSYHKATGQLLPFLPTEVPVMEIGINQTWKRQIQVLRRKGRSVRLRMEKSI
jgi:hypothetical protein